MLPAPNSLFHQAICISSLTYLNRVLPPDVCPRHLFQFLSSLPFYAHWLSCRLRLPSHSRWPQCSGLCTPCSSVIFLRLIHSPPSTVLVRWSGIVSRSSGDLGGGGIPRTRALLNRSLLANASFSGM